VGDKRDVLLGASIWLSAVVVGLWIRVSSLTALPLYGDEYHTLQTAVGTYGEILSYFDAVGSHMALPFLQRLAQDVFGEGILAMRVPAIVPAMLTLILLWPLGRRLVGSAPALVATAALAVSPIHVFYSRFGRSYALTALLALLLVDAVRRATAEAGRTRHWGLVALWSTLLPYVHLSSVGLVGSIAAAALWLAWRRDRSARALAAPIAAFAVAGVICALMFLPARESLADYLSKIKGQGFLEGIGLLDVPTILAGGRVAGLTLLLGVPLGALVMIAREPRSGILSLAAIAGPLAAMLVFKPNGMAYAYARYVHVALPVMLCVLAWLLVELVRGFGAPTPARDRAAVALGVGLAGLLHWTGPRAPWRTGNGPYDNTYLAMRRLPAFDLPYPETPAFYAQLAEDEAVKKIIEAPPMGSRSILLYRNYYLQHGVDTVFGLLTPKMETLINGPYERVFDRELAETSGADYLIVHMNLGTETAAYWNWVYHHAWAEPAGDPDASYMIRHRIYLDPPGAISMEMVRPLNRRFGRPVYTDERIRVWKLK
jgi:hypothetical protein